MLPRKVGTVLRSSMVFALALLALPVTAQDRAGDFSHFVLALSWSPSWCAREGDARGASQCDPERDFAFTLHGLWPQRERGWPEYCRTDARDPTRAETAEMADIMGSAGLAWHQWKKHGRCTGLPATRYFALSRRAYAGIRQPEALTSLERAIVVEPAAVEQAFLDANPGLRADQIAVTCKDSLLQEVRICLTFELSPRACTPQVERGCRASSIQLPPVR